jgi:hypothetical protein
MNVANSVLLRMTIILKANKFNLFVSSVLFIFWYHSPNVLDTPRTLEDNKCCSYAYSTSQKQKTVTKMAAVSCDLKSFSLVVLYSY